MIIDLLCSDHQHPVNIHLEKWMQINNRSHDIELLRDVSELRGGDVLFLISCHQIIKDTHRTKYCHALVIHASDLPSGRGWSPHIWAILNGASEICVTLLDANDPVDTGDIWAKHYISIPRHALYDEINQALFEAELILMDSALELIENNVKPTPQPPGRASYWPKRNSSDSEIDPSIPLADSFDKIRVADPVRYPAFFEIHGHKFYITVRKDEVQAND